MNNAIDGLKVQANHHDALEERHDERRREKTCCTAMNVTPPVSGKPEEEDVLTHVSITDRQRCISRPVVTAALVQLSFRLSRISSGT